MLASIGKYPSVGFQFLEKGLAHPTFLGRLISWGIFYGVLAFTVSKIAQYAIPKIKQYREDRKPKLLESNKNKELSISKPINTNIHKEKITPKSIKKDAEINPPQIKEDIEINPEPINPAPPIEQSTFDSVPLDHKEVQIPTGEPGEGVKKKISSWFKG